MFFMRENPSPGIRTRIVQHRVRKTTVEVVKGGNHHEEKPVDGGGECRRAVLPITRRLGYKAGDAVTRLPWIILTVSRITSHAH